MIVSTNDDERFDIDWDVFRRMRTLVMNDNPDLNPQDEVVPLPNVTSAVFQKVLEYCEHHRHEPIPPDDGSSSNDDPRKRQVSEIGEWDREFIQVDQEMLFEIILAANYLNIKDLLDLGCKTVAEMIKEKTPEEIRKLFNIVNDFTPEEEAQIRLENEWAEDREAGTDFSMEGHRNPTRRWSTLSYRGRSSAWVRTIDEPLMSVPSSIFAKFKNLGVDVEDTSYSHPKDIGINSQTLRRIIDLCDAPFYGYIEPAEINHPRDELFSVLEGAKYLGIQSLVNAGLPAFGHLKSDWVQAPMVSLSPNTKVVPNSYIITLKESCKYSTHIQWLRGLEDKYCSTPDTCKLMYEYKLANGYSATLGKGALEEVQGSPDVEGIIPNQEVQACVEGPEPGGLQNISEPPRDATPVTIDDGMEAESNVATGDITASNTIQPVIQTDAPWNLRRINERNPLPDGSDCDRLDFHYYHLPPSPLEPEIAVDIYVLDSGVSIEHVDFGGRARRPAGVDVPRPYGVGDDFGHGTHVAGTAAGARWGVAKHAHIVDVKVLDSHGNSDMGHINAGLQWAIEDAMDSGRPGVINISIHVPHDNTIFNRLCAAAVRMGVHICLAAENNTTCAPARETGVITVGASSITDEKWVDSNFGPNIDIFAPGDRITSACFSCITGHRMMSGTSMAAPHVSGMIACLIHQKGNLAPAQMLAQLQSISTRNALRLDKPDTWLVRTVLSRAIDHTNHGIRT
ncbi:hypothetical protein FRC09_017078 [Ceratobasidium sp. 395]|nr:hypothetical protein FRC09_017078 [Ceratobasidium sp. 395]